MYFQGVLATTTTLPNLQADIIGILTGAITTPAQVSSNFQPGTIFNNTVAPGWELHDNAAGAAANGVTPKVIRAPYSDDPTKFKNVFINSPAASQLGFNGYESWNPATHVGVNPMQAVIAVSGFQAMALTAGTMIIISASANHILIHSLANLQSTASGNIYFTEYSRDDPWNTVANGYPSWLQTGLFNNIPTTPCIAASRVYDPGVQCDKISALLTGNPPSFGYSPNATFCPNGQYVHASNTFNGGGGGLGGQTYIPVLSSNYLSADADKATTKFLYDIAIRMCAGNSVPVITGAFLGGNCSAIAPHVFYAANNNSNGDVIVMNNKKYQIVSIQYSKFAILME